MQISFITIAKDNYEEFVKTFTSISRQASRSDEYIIVDGSSDDQIKAFVASAPRGLFSALVYRYLAPSGIYKAINLGVSVSSRPWLWIVNSGDLLECGARNSVEDVLSSNNNHDIIVGGQRYGYGDGRATYIFQPSERSVWPHQSILYKKILHRRFGYYDVGLKSGADQMFFAIARKHADFCILKKVLSSYLLGGYSSTVSLRAAREVYLVSIALGRNPFQSFLLSCRPFVKAVLTMVFGKSIMTRIASLLPGRHRVVSLIELE